MQIKSEQLALFLKQRRKQIGYSQNQLSDALGMGSSGSQFVSNVERGLCQMPLKYIPELSKRLDVSQEEIVNMMTLDYKTSILGVLNGTNHELSQINS
jgi:transcriptional regulator with XRE-family HTH domain